MKWKQKNLELLVNSNCIHACTKHNKQQHKIEATHVVGYWTTANEKKRRHKLATIIKLWLFELIADVLSFRMCICWSHSVRVTQPFSVHIFTYVRTRAMVPFANDNFSLTFNCMAWLQYQRWIFCRLQHSPVHHTHTIKFNCTSVFQFLL